MSSDFKQVLILCKTYPSPSAKHIETSCVAGMDDTGKLIRLFPVPFRLVADVQQFKKWQWIKARVKKSTDDHRLESHRISVDTIEVLGEPLTTRNAWQERRMAVDQVEIFHSFSALEDARRNRGVTLAFLKPSRLADISITKAASDKWSDDEIAKLMQAQTQGSLFDELAEQSSLTLLKKLPYDFHYHYECEEPDGVRLYKHKLVDWEAGALYWNIHRRPDWQGAFRQKFLGDFAQRDLLFLMGTIHRFPDQWLIVSALYFPTLPSEALDQQRLF
jgi:hypothetical protein